MDLRDWLREVDSRGKLKIVRGAHWDLEIGAITELMIKKKGSPALLFDVYNPHGRRYQVLLATPRVVVSERDGHRVKKVSKTREATLAVAGSSIALTSMFGKWRVEPRLEGQSRRCGPAEYFTIRP